jgi:hypothetical protein
VSAADGREPWRRRQILGILLIAAVILLIAFLRADRHGIFPRGWWRW